MEKSSMKKFSSEFAGWLMFAGITALTYYFILH